jgi:hypothetical protein
MRLVASLGFPTLIDGICDNEVPGRRVVETEPVPERQAANTQAGGIAEKNTVARERLHRELLPSGRNGLFDSCHGRSVGLRRLSAAGIVELREKRAAAAERLHALLDRIGEKDISAWVKG